MEDEDYAGFTTVLLFAIGERTKCVAVSIVNDTIAFEGEELFSASLRLRVDYGGRIQLQPSLAAVTIVGEYIYLHWG